MTARDLCELAPETGVELTVRSEAREHWAFQEKAPQTMTETSHQLALPPLFAMELKWLTGRDRFRNGSGEDPPQIPEVFGTYAILFTRLGSGRATSGADRCLPRGCQTSR